MLPSSPKYTGILYFGAMDPLTNLNVFNVLHNVHTLKFYLRSSVRDPLQGVQKVRRLTSNEAWKLFPHALQMEGLLCNSSF